MEKVGGEQNVAPYPGFLLTDPETLNKISKLSSLFRQFSDFWLGNDHNYGDKGQSIKTEISQTPKKRR